MANDHPWQDQVQQLSNIKGSKGLFSRKKQQPSPHHTLAHMESPTTLSLGSASVAKQLSLTLWHVVRDVLAPIKLDPPQQASLATRDLYALLMGKGVSDYSFQALGHLSVNLHDVLLDYFLQPKASYSRIQIDALELVVRGEPKGSLGQWQLPLRLADGSLKMACVSHACVVRGSGSYALQSELQALFSLRSQLFRGVQNATAYSHKVVVQVEGLTAMMAEAAGDARVSDSLKESLNQQVFSLFNSPNDLALVDSKTKLSAFQVEIGQLAEINDYIYSELARMLQVPKSKLLGQSSNALGHTGSYDYQHYQDYLESIRTHLLYPFLDQLAISYQRHKALDSQQMQAGLNLLNQLHTQHDQLQHNELVALKQRLIQSLLEL